MRRCLFKLAIFLVLGAIINVAVAWGIASTSSLRHDQWRFLSDDETRHFLQSNGRAVNERILSGTVSTGVGWRTMNGAIKNIPNVPANLSKPPPAQSLPSGKSGIREATAVVVQSLDFYEYAFGLPALALRWKTDGQQPEWVFLPSWVGFRSGQSLPLNPVWPGFAINTIFYALLLWAFLAVPFAIRRRRRIKRGVCVRCAYPVGTSSLCSECGTPALHGAVALGGPATPDRDYR